MRPPHLERYLHYLSKEPTLNGAIAWRRMRRHARWSHRYAEDVKRGLRNALHNTPWATSLGSAQAGKDVHFEAPRSARNPHFLLGECLPRRSGTPQRCALLRHLACLLADSMRSVSKGGLRDGVALLHRILPPEVCDVNVLKEWSAERWLIAYEEAYKHNRMAFSTFKSHLRTLNAIQNTLLTDSHCGKGVARIPVPRLGGRLPSEVQPSLTGIVSTSNAGEFDRQRILRDTIQRMRMRMCRPRDPLQEAMRRHAFGVDETHRILRSAETERERLMVLLLLSTGVRLGGLCRIRWNGDAHNPADIPPELWTTEKNGVARCLPLSDACRILVYRWMRSRGADNVSRYLFPSPRDPDRSMGLRTAWGVCADVLRRAGVRGPHAHPHTFRHTTVQILYLAGGLSFETIAKWIGHRSATTTSVIYGQIQQEDLCARLNGLPFVDDVGDGAERRAAWMGLAEAIRQPPYDISVWEWACVRRCKPHCHYFSR